MREEFIKEEIILDKSEEDIRIDLLNGLNSVKNSLKVSYNNMKYAEGDLVDYYIYKIKSEEAQYAYLLKKIKEEQKQ